MRTNFKKTILIVFLNICLIASFHITAKNCDALDFEALLKDMQSTDFQIRLAAVESIGKVRDERSVDALIDLLTNRYEDWEIQIIAIRYLGESKSPKAVYILLQFLDNVLFNYDCPAVKSNTAIALSNFKDNQRVFEALLYNLTDSNLQVREAAVQSLGEIGNKDAVPFLARVLKENSFALKFSAIKALEKIGDPAAIIHLKRIVTNEQDPILRREALRAIRKLQISHNTPVAQLSPSKKCGSFAS